jgi:uncharacterized membrane protein (DUF485 family)
MKYVKSGQFSAMMTQTSVITIINVTPTKTLYIYIHSFIHSFVHQWLSSPLLGPDIFFSFIIFFTQTVGLLGRVISPSQGLYLHTGQHNHRKMHTDIHALSGIRTHDPTIRASEDSSRIRSRDLFDRLIYLYRSINYVPLSSR